MAIIKGGESMRKSSTPKKVKTPQIHIGTEVKHTGVYDYVDTEFEGIKKVVSKQGGFLVFIDKGRVHEINKKTGLSEVKHKKTMRRVETLTEASQLRLDAAKQREKIKALGANHAYAVNSGEDFTLNDVIYNFKKDEFYNKLSENYQMHYDNYLKHIADFMGYKKPCEILVRDINDYYNYLLERGNFSSAKKNKDGSVSKKEVSKTNPNGLSVNTIPKHKTALKALYNYMIKEEIYGVMLNYAELSKVPTITMEIDGKPVEFEKIPPEQRNLTLDELNYTLNDAVQNEMDRSIVLLIALGAIGGLRRGEMAALKVGRYFHNELMLLGNDIWKLNDFYKLREYYEEHDELILIDEAIIHNRTDVLTLPKGKNIRAVGKPNCLDSIVSYCLEQRNQLNSILGRSLDGAQRLYMPMRNIILGTDYSAAKITRKWMQYQVRRNERMVEKGLEPIEIIRLHDLRHTHCTLMHEGGVPDKDTADNAGHVAYVLKNGELNNTTTKVYIHDKRMDRTNVIKFWDENIHIDWDKARRDDINAPGNKAHVNGSGHVVLKNEEMERIRNLKGRPWLSEEEEAELLCSKYKDVE